MRRIAVLVLLSFALLGIGVVPAVAAERSVTALSASVPGHVTVAADFAIEGALSWPSVRVHVSRAGADGVVEFDVMTGANGAFSATDRVSAAGDYTYTLTYEGDDSRAPATEQAGTVAGKRATALALNANASVRAGEKHTVSGALTWPGSTVHVTRTTDSGTVALTDVVADENGAFAFDDAVGRAGSATYAVTYDGTELNEAATETLAVDVTALPFVLALYPPVVPQAGVPYEVRGSITPAQAGVVVHVTRVLDGTSWVSLGDVTTAVDGSFVVTDTAPVRGSYRYVVTATDASAADLATWVGGQAPHLSITTNGERYRYADVATVTLHLGPTTNRTARIYATPAGGRRVLVRSGTVDANGNLVARWSMRTNTTFTAEFDGDTGYEPATVGITAYAAARVTERLDGSTLHVSVAPNHGGDCVVYLAQKWVDGAWRTVRRNACVRLDRYSRAHVALATTKGARYRVRASFLGDARNTASIGAWRYVTAS